GTMGGLQAAVPAGKRAVTVEVNEVSGLSGMLRPGARVDIVATLTDEVTRETVTRAIVQNVPVSAVGTQMNKDGGGGEVKDAANGVQVKTVTLIVTPEQASALDLAYTRSRPRLVLRNAGEDDDSRFKPVTLQQLVRGTNPGASDEDRAHLKPATSGPGFTDLLAAMAAQRARQRAEPGATAAPPATQPVRRAVEVIRAGVPSLTYMENGKAATPETPAPKKAGMFESSNAH
ncbi:MAG TPA: Flp pilus assembly protein CpaB, partial [Tepidisphaeraceae bacterium]|nr:Flp pilus assembly protein CpaB [Tepidisphaeraceae bacterium]